MRGLLNALVLTLVALLSGGLVVVGIAKAQQAAARARCENNLKQIGLGIHNSHDSNGHFPLAAVPAAGLPPEGRLSWLVALSPYVEATDFFVRMDRKKGWEAEENRYVAVSTTFWLECTACRDRPPVSTLVPTPYVGITGLGPEAASLPQGHPRAGPFAYGRKLVFGEILGRTSSLMVVAETGRTSGAWTAGGTATARGLEEGEPYLGPEGQLGGRHWGTAQVLIADGSVRPLPENTHPRLLRALATIEGSEEVGED